MPKPRKKAKQVTLPPVPHAGVTGLEMTDARQVEYQPKGEARNVRMRRRAKAVEILHSKLTARQALAGEELGDQYAISAGSPSAGSTERVEGNSGDGDGFDRRMAAGVWLSKAMLACGPNAWPVVQHVCCYDRCLRDGMAKNGQDAAMLLPKLRKGLDAVADLMRLN